MIINDTHKFCFIHIPKCAGSYLRKQIQTFDETDGEFTNRVDNHPVLGRVDYVHLPLSILKEYFSYEYKKIQSYHSVAILRDPFERFSSSLSQSISMYGEKPIRKLSKAEIKKKIDYSISYLTKSSEIILPHDYIHFQRQVSFVNVNQKQVVSKLYAINQISELVQDISEILPLEENNIESTKDVNRGYSYKTEWIKKSLMFFPSSFKRQIFQAMPEKYFEKVKNVIYQPRDRRIKDMLSTKYVQSFIENYYTEDIELYNSILK